MNGLLLISANSDYAIEAMILRTGAVRSCFVGKSVTTILNIFVILVSEGGPVLVNGNVWRKSNTHRIIKAPISKLGSLIFNMVGSHQKHSSDAVQWQQVT